MSITQNYFLRMLVVWGLFGFFSSVSYAQSSFEAWKAEFYKKAVNNDVSEQQLSQLQQLSPYQRAIQSDKNQSEFKKFLWDYLSSAVSKKRVATGRQKIAQHRALLNTISQQTGVPPQIMVAIWGVETSYGSFTGSVPVMRSMATLAYEGRRRQFFEGELLAALSLIDDGHIPHFSVEGSWAGGLGMSQFIPTSYLQYGVDYDGDGIVNLWQVDDALASIGNYLSSHGWRAQQTWGREVTVVDGFDYMQANLLEKKSLMQWQALGVRDARGMDLPDDAISARLFVPAGQFGPKFLLYKNFDVIKSYNNSDSYALAVSLLSDRIAGSAGLVASWPHNAKKTTVNDIKIVQTALNSFGFNAGKVDGVFGNGTRRALQAYQAANGMVADGFLTVDLYRKLITNND